MLRVLSHVQFAGTRRTVSQDRNEVVDPESIPWHGGHQRWRRPAAGRHDVGRHLDPIRQQVAGRRDVSDEGCAVPRSALPHRRRCPDGRRTGPGSPRSAPSPSRAPCTARSAPSGAGPRGRAAGPCPERGEPVRTTAPDSDPAAPPARTGPGIGDRLRSAPRPRECPDRIGRAREREREARARENQP